MSGQLPVLKEGAASSLLLSPMNTNEGCSDELDELLEPRLELGVELLEVPELVLPELVLPPRLLPLVPPELLLRAELEARSNDHGTGTSFSPVVAEVAPAVPLDELVLELDPVVLLVPGLVLLPLLELSWITAKSIRPELGLTRTSLTVPSWSPDVDVICAPVN
jgi:hypothetical protein